MILVNSNPATIMTDPGLADATYVEPITPEIVEKIIAREKPDALLPTMGGQTALNTAMQLAAAGTLAQLRRRADRREGRRDRPRRGPAEIPRRDDRDRHREPEERDRPFHGGGARGARRRSACPPSSARASRSAAPAAASPITARSSSRSSPSGLDASPTTEVLIEESVLGWKEYEMEVVRDRADNCIIVCSIENVDPMGVHTGDSVTVAPALTLTDKEYQRMRDASIACLRAIGVDTGGSNVQFAAQSRRWPHGGDRDEPARLALLRARLQGDGLSDRQDRREARRRLHARRAEERHHPHHAGELRADDRLRRGEDPALHLREIPRHAGACSPPA